MSAHNRIGRSTSDRIFDGVVFIVLTLVMLVVAYPLYFIIISSFSDPLAVASGSVTLVPIGFTLEGYNKVFQEETVIRGFLNSLFYTALGVSINLLITIPTSYALSRKDFFGRKPITTFYLITMFVGGGLIPTYLVVQQTGLMDTVWALVVPGALTVYNMIVARTFFTTNIPGELMEAARLDGCGNTRFFFYIVLPLSSALIAILTLYYGIGHWNSYFKEMIYLKNRSKFPLSLFLREILVQSKFAETAISSGEAYSAEEMLALMKQADTANMLKYCFIVISTAPMLIIYPFLQGFFEKGVMIGSIKG